jgi:pyridinium-3,5-biscarboxylic acid mononucleotide synthase
VDNDTLKALLDQVQSGAISPDAALSELRWQPSQPVERFAQVDHHRMVRQGMPEFVYAESKTPQHTADIMAAMVARTGHALASRATEGHYEATRQELPTCRYNPVSRLLTVDALPSIDAGTVLVVAAGTSDLPVAEEALGVLRYLGHEPKGLNDVGVAGIHRLFAQSDVLASADVLIVVAGMEGALPTVIAGLVDVPVIAVPTSVGYGASFGGLAALLGMLNSCATGLTVVNIDNGLGAAAAAHRILRTVQ